ncbi:hypothetical protein [Micromonospora inyonensis]|uniref:Alpha/beta hydrolase family protein n=1 Tax=Micromonospora inyonensis TaxID=47866 RepID=A0A1C6R931_9ACTN|nr:hypothetical protein [Micromonospora inyonensis]SCL13576.1 hypothetical protein GA0074694_0395 [Micromonospora inyonensis]
MSGPPNVGRKGDGLPLVAIHGNGVDHPLLLALDDCPAEPGCGERIYLDLPGFGGTPPLDGTGGLPALPMCDLRGARRSRANVHLEQPDIVHALLREWSGRVRSTIGGDPGEVRFGV